MAADAFQQYLEKTRTLADLTAAVAVLGWDQETYMPDGAAQGRAEQISTLSALVHQMTVESGYGDLIRSLSGSSNGNGLEEWQKASLKESLRDLEMATKLPEEHVREFARATSLAQHSWKQARAEKNYALFADALTHLVELKRNEAEYLGYAENPYDALIDQFEPGMTVAQLTPVFTRLREGTRVLLERIAAAPNKPDDSVLFTDFDKEKQLAYSREMVAKLGFNFGIGRVDLSAHPFCTSFGMTDVRLTTRIFNDDLRSCLFGLIHEAGHGMYEQGVDPAYTRTPLASGTSMGIHESQSLFWENMIARSEPFWQWAFPSLQSTFPGPLGSLDASGFFRAINVVKPSFIRIESDELTYNLHIVIRFEIENALINGQITVADVPELWNSKMHEYLGITPADDAEGCLQDVHWSFGGFGYFPSYTLGKLYAAMFYRQMKREMPDLEAQITAGQFTNVLAWLREKIHRWGKSKRSATLVMEICNEPLSESAFLEYMTGKVERVYGLG
ncbi:MAG TPA: carboxypeptidase M32 [Candidatus Kapabacteria bacterium]|nr:carboxypeptidase M32 [Candidatus Kapabacteria bacterium]